jgi:[ribosomal protein S18]-alanine N-acetyltransferase
MHVLVRAFTHRDLPSVIEIAAASPDAAQWSRESYSSLLESSAQGWVAASGEAILGFLLARKAADEMEILNLAVSPASRRKGIGSMLLREALSWASRNQIAKVHLEARASNSAAMRFYESHGFRTAGQRPGYYSHPLDDAVLLFLPVAEK